MSSAPLLDRGHRRIRLVLHRRKALIEDIRQLCRVALAVDARVVEVVVQADGHAIVGVGDRPGRQRGIHFQRLRVAVRLAQHPAVVASGADSRHRSLPRLGQHRRQRGVRRARHLVARRLVEQVQRHDAGSGCLESRVAGDLPPLRTEGRRRPASTKHQLGRAVRRVHAVAVHRIEDHLHIGSDREHLRDMRHVRVQQRPAST